MRLASFQIDGQMGYGQTGYGFVSDEGVHPVTAEFAARFPSLKSVLAADQLAVMAKQCLPVAVPLAAVTLLPPIPDPGKIICAGMNYRKPYPVAGVAPPDPNNVVIFSRHTETLVGHGAALEMPLGAAAQSYDFEGEIAVVIGKSGRHITSEDALSYVAGYAVMNEGSVRGWMKHSVHAGKNFHASGAWGPWIVTVDMVEDINDLHLQTLVNNVVMQSASAAEMIFSLPELIAYISHLLPLHAGDVIATGSPDGTGGSRTPPAFLKQGDLVQVSVSGIGQLENRVGSPLFEVGPYRSGI